MGKCLQVWENIYLLHRCKGGHNLTSGNTGTTDEEWGGEKPLGGFERSKAKTGFVLLIKSKIILFLAN